MERRKYYRIDDTIRLRYEVLNEQQPQNTRTDAAKADARDLLAEIDRELNQAVNTIWSEHPVVARALGLINRKLSVIATETLDLDDGESRPYADTRVNLSGCGVAFDAQEALAVGTRLCLFMVLRPSQVSVSISGTVVACETATDRAAVPYQLRVDFDDDLQAQEELIQHVVQKQAALLYDMTADSEPGPSTSNS